MHEFCAILCVQCILEKKVSKIKMKRLRGASRYIYLLTWTLDQWIAVTELLFREVYIVILMYVCGLGAYISGPSFTWPSATRWLDWFGWLGCLALPFESVHRPSSTNGSAGQCPPSSLYRPVQLMRVTSHSLLGRLNR